MSSTRRATDGALHQEGFCSSPAFKDGLTINAQVAAKRIAIVREAHVREILWFIQWRSLTPGGLQQLCDELISAFPERVGMPTLRKLQKGSDRELTHREHEMLRSESRGRLSGRYEDWSDLFAPDDAIRTNSSRYFRIAEVVEQLANTLHKLPERLVKFCVDPSEEITKGVWYFDDLLGVLVTLRARFTAAARSRLADTLVTRTIGEALDFCFEQRRMVLIEGVAGIGRTATLRAWCDAQAGLVRYVEVPSSNDDRSFYSSMAQALGVARGFAYNPQQIKLRVEDTLRESGLIIALDESQYLWPQYHRPRGIPPRMLWLKTLFDAGTPFALVAHSDFSKWQAHYVKKTLWSDEQFVRRLNRSIVLSPEHSKEDMLKIARAVSRGRSA